MSILVTGRVLWYTYKSGTRGDIASGSTRPVQGSNCEENHAQQCLKREKDGSATQSIGRAGPYHHCKKIAAADMSSCCLQLYSREDDGAEEGVLETGQIKEVYRQVNRQCMASQVE